jgi:deferrochelatase/peroxidase EfeB
VTALVFVRLAPGLDAPAVQQWLVELHDLVGSLEAGRSEDGANGARVIIGFGAHYFARFPDLAANNPHDLFVPPDLTVRWIAADMFLHVVAPSDALVDDLLRRLWRTRPIVAELDVEHGHGPADGPPVVGDPDGAADLSPEQLLVVSLDVDNRPEEPGWLHGGTYAAYLKLEQDLDEWHRLDHAERDRLIGRHLDEDLVVRRGTPYVETVDGALHVGYQLVTYQSGLDALDAAVNRWRVDPQISSLVTVRRIGAFVVPPPDARFPGAGYFDVTPSEADQDARVHVRLLSTDPVTWRRAEVGGFDLQLVDPTTGQPLGPSARTDAAGRALLLGARIGQEVVVREAPDDPTGPAVEHRVQVDARQVVVRLAGRLRG